MKFIIIFVSIIILTNFSFSNGLIFNDETGISDTPKPRHPKIEIIATEYVGGFLGGAIAGTLIGYGSALVFKDREEGEHLDLREIQAYFLGAIISYPFGAAIGTYWAGSSLKQRGNFLPTLTGTLVGVPVMLWLFYLSSGLKSQYLLLIPGITVPPLGAVIGYNLSRPKSSKQQSFYQHLNLPTIGLRTEKSDLGKTITCLDLKLINAKF